MSSNSPLNADQVQELLALRATEGLSAEDASACERLLTEDPALAEDAEQYELAAAAAHLAMAGESSRAEALPAALRDRLLAEAKTHLGSPGGTPSLKLAPAPAADTPASASAPSASRSPLFSLSAIGWYAAAAAAVALMFVIASRAPQDRTVSPAQAYSTLAKAPGTVAAQWQFNDAGGDIRFSNASGEVIFNAADQAGYMKLTGLPVNDPAQEQYQLWIVDASRAGETTDRIDGGVFDVNADGEVIIPITAAVTAEQPVVFAITVEKPGGVVVSKGPLQVVAAVESNG